MACQQTLDNISRHTDSVRFWRGFLIGLAIAFVIATSAPAFARAQDLPRSLEEFPRGPGTERAAPARTALEQQTQTTRELLSVSDPQQLVEMRAKLAQQGMQQSAALKPSSVQNVFVTKVSWRASLP